MASVDQNAGYKRLLELFGIGAPQASAQTMPDTQAAVDQAVAETNASQDMGNALQDSMDEQMMGASQPQLQSITQSLMYKTPEQKALEKQYEQAVQDQLSMERASVDKNQRLMELLANQPSQESLAPTLSYLQNITGTKFELPKVQSPEEKQKQLLDMLKQVQGSESDLSKNQVSALKALLDSRGSGDALKLALAQGRMDQVDKRMDLTGHHRVVAALKGNKQLMTNVNNYRNLNKALNLTLNKKDLTPQDIHEFQQSIRGALGIKGTSGVTEREETYLKNAGWNVEAVKQFLSGEPAQIAKNSPLVQHLVEIAQGMKENIKTDIDSDIAIAKGGYEDMYERRPDLAKSVESLTGAIRQASTTRPELNKAIEKSKEKTPSKKELNDEFAKLYRSK